MWSGLNYTVECLRPSSLGMGEAQIYSALAHFGFLSCDREGTDTGLFQAKNTCGCEGRRPLQATQGCPFRAHFLLHECISALLPVQSDGEGEACEDMCQSCHMRVAGNRAFWCPLLPFWCKSKPECHQS